MKVEVEKEKKEVCEVLLLLVKFIKKYYWLIFIISVKIRIKVVELRIDYRIGREESREEED